MAAKLSFLEGEKYFRSCCI